mmetsp:Transcript_1082/g.1996  ORF Transcript_1082/g.1996 Transcript_1082/m.1996 type:complete len:119 (+) Transcript_1082:382-738(+)
MSTFKVNDLGRASSEMFNEKQRKDLEILKIAFEVFDLAKSGFADQELLRPLLISFFGNQKMVDEAMEEIVSQRLETQEGQDPILVVDASAQYSGGSESEANVSISFGEFAILFWKLEQ